jgi:hypothetical protein
MKHTDIISPTLANHTGDSSPTFVHHVGDEPPVSASYAKSMSPTIVNDVGGIHIIDKPRHVRHKPKFLCRLCKGDHLTYLCSTTVVVQEAWSLSGGPSGSESSLVSQHYVSPLNDTTIMLMQSSPDPTLVLRSETSFDHVINISSQVPFEQERDLLSPSTLPPSLGEVSFKWDGLVWYQIPSPMPFQIRGVL